MVASDEPDAWHPMDMLVAPLYDAHGVLRGTLAIDEPLDGRLPDLERRRVLEKFAVLAARAVLASVERESLAEQVAMADTVKAIVRTTSAQLSLSGLLEASEQTLLDGFAAQRLWIKTVADDDQSPTDYLPGDLSLAPPARRRDVRGELGGVLLAPPGRDEDRHAVPAAAQDGRAPLRADRRAAAQHLDVVARSSSPSARAPSAWAAWC